MTMMMMMMISEVTREGSVETVFGEIFNIQCKSDKIIT